MNLKKMAAFLCLALFVFYGQSNPNKIGLDKLTAELQAKLDELTGHKDLPGATLAVVLPGERKICLASGMADIEKKRKMVPTDRMLSGSIGKTYLVAIILQLEEENKLKIDDPVKKYFNGEAWYSQLPNGNDLTLRMLLNHTGFAPGYNSVMMYVPGYKFSIAFQFNCDNVFRVLKKSRHDNAAEFTRIVVRFLNEKSVPGK